jgi:diguanylate cyclase (GGDEF)-like protein
MQINFNQLSIDKIFMLSKHIKEKCKNLSSFEEVAQELVRVLYSSFVAEGGRSPFVLARFFKSCSYGELPDDIRNYIHNKESKGNLISDNKYLTLLGSFGELDNWKNRNLSENYKAFPIHDEHMLDKFPMLSAVFDQIGLNLSLLRQTDKSILIKDYHRQYGVFCVENTEGSNLIPKQAEFVRPYSVKSVFGFGGIYSTSNVYAVLVFSRERISREDAQLFLSLNPAIKQITLSHEITGDIFKTDRKDTNASVDGICDENPTVQIKSQNKTISRQHKDIIEKETALTTSVELKMANEYLLQMSEVLMKKNKMLVKEIENRKKVEEELMSVREKLQKQANHDNLTGLFNRQYMSEILDKEFSRALRYQTDLSCLILDLDYFKDINDTFGHPFGDMVLREFSDCLRQNARKSDITFRYGGEEFMLLLPNTSIDGARDVAEKIRASCDKKRYEEGKNSTTVTVSIGIASVKEHQLLEYKALLALADKALYLSKAEGRNRVTVYMKDASGQSSGEKTSEENNLKYLKDKLSLILEKTKKSSTESLELLTRDMADEEHKQRNHDLKRYIRLIGAKLALPPTIIETFTRAANFHNNFNILMGKSFIDRNKVLSRDEKVEIEAHPFMLSELTELFDFFTNERSILLHHHENFDGTGYPGGLKENEIPLGARIFAITDAITSMLSERQYRPKLSPEEMVEELADKAGTQFDPSLVSLFIDIIESQKLFPVPVEVLEKAREKILVRKHS